MMTAAPWLPLDESAFTDALPSDTAHQLWSEISKIKGRQPDDASQWRCMFEPRRDLGGIKVRVQWMTKRLNRDGLSPNEVFWIVDGKNGA